VKPKTIEEQDDEAVIRQIAAGRRRAAEIQEALGWPPQARYTALDAALQRLRRAGRIEYRKPGGWALTR
jgi:hypothetical protein